MDDNLFNEEVKEEYIVSSLVRGLQILSTFTRARPVLKVSDIAEITGFNQATVFRFVYTLEKLGYLSKDEGTKQYRQSVRMISLGLPAREGIAVLDISLPNMMDLSKAVNESVRLAVLDGSEIVTIGVAEIPERLYFRTRIGERAPALSMALGKVLFAFQPYDSLDSLFSKYDSKGNNGFASVDLEKVREELSQIQKQGYSIQDGELIPGLSSIAAPIFNFNNEIIAAIDISGLSSDILEPRKKELFINELVKNASKISVRLGQVQ
ncbi:MAG: IclR family transcriptional regulator [Chloroflexota bacterium]